MSEQLDRFISLLKGIFELDKSDLDFGIYRIMNIRKKEIEKFLAEGLPARVKDALAPFAGNTSDIEKRIAEIEKQCDTVGIEVANSKMAGEYNELKATLAKGVDLSGLEADVYSQLYSFFNRYYEEGDFISKRRYKEGVYAIPYEGEEVKLYWANQDQYYIKTSENFKDYTFVAEGYNIHFRLVDATTEQNNNKESKDNKRVFMLYTEDPERPELKTFEFNAEKKELIIRFVFDIPEDKKAKYEELNDKAITTWLIGNCQELVTVLLVNISSDPKKKQNLLQKHLRSYVAKNTFDYFIHKDLKKFLTRELDFFIKNEVMHLDDVDTTDEKRVDTWLAKVRAIKRVGHVIIDFLASIEDFQKKLWLKKKFVVQCDYCITLDRIPESFHKEIAQNIDQWREWEKLGFFRLTTLPTLPDQIQVKFDQPGINDYSVYLSSGRIEKLKVVDENNELPTYLFEETHFFEQFKSLQVDTKFFPIDFKQRLLAKIENFDEQCDGLLIHSENFQALNLLQQRYREQVKCVYIDPPYNTGSENAFVYKDSYQHSSWISCLADRLRLAQKLATYFSGFWISTDDGEYANLKLCMDTIFGNNNFVADIIWNSRKSVSNDALISAAINHTTFYSKDKATLDKYKNIFRIGKTEEGFSNPDNDPRGDWKLDPMDAPNVRENLSYGITNPETGETFYPPEGRHWRFEEPTTKKYMEEGRILFGRTGKGRPAFKRFLSEAQDKGQAVTTLWDDVKTTTDATKMLLDYFGDTIPKTYIDKIKPKPIQLIDRMLQLLSDSRQVAIDFFAGSGTTGHAVLNLNREDDGTRKYILIEMGEHFDTVLKPRIEKVVYSADWKDGKPVVKPNGNEQAFTDFGGISHCFKYMRLESYEDALSNVELPEDKSVERMVSLFGDEYLIKYMLDFDTAGSVLNLAAFNDPFDYKLKVTEKNETKEVNADLTETFNYLIGLTVDKMYARKIFSASPDPAGEYEGAVKLIGNDNGEYIFRQIEGTLPSGERALIIWRNITDNLLESNAALDAYFQRYRINPADREYDVIFVNGDNNIANLKNTEETWKVRMIEPEFKSRMFEEE